MPTTIPAAGTEGALLADSTMSQGSVATPSGASTRSQDTAGRRSSPGPALIGGPASRRADQSPGPGGPPPLRCTSCPDEVGCRSRHHTFRGGAVDERSGSAPATPPRRDRIDGTDDGERALYYGLALAKREHLPVRLVHVPHQVAVYAPMMPYLPETTPGQVGEAPRRGLEEAGGRDRVRRVGHRDGRHRGAAHTGHPAPEQGRRDMWFWAPEPLAFQHLVTGPRLCRWRHMRPHRCIPCLATGLPTTHRRER